jgi:hypothetical protein
VIISLTTVTVANDTPPMPALCGKEVLWLRLL